MVSPRGKRAFAGCSAGLVLILASWAPVQAAEHRLVLDEADPAAAASGRMLPPAGFPLARRSRPVALTPRLALSDGFAAGDTLAIHLFEDAVYTARIDRVETNGAGTVCIRARIEDYPLSEVLISTTAGRTLASIRIPEKDESFIIQSEARSCQHYLLDVSGIRNDELPCGQTPAPPPPPAPKPGSPDAPRPTALNGPLDPVTIDVMIVYTPAAEAWANSSGGGIANVMAQAMQRAQLSHDNSNTVVTLNLLHSAPVNYTESGNSSTDLNRLTNFDGYMDEVRNWRDQHGADMVVLFAYVSDVGGVGWLLNSTSGNPQTAFCLVRVQQAATGYTHGHELGHNMGCHHHRDQNVQPGPGLFSYSAGGRWVGTNNGRYCSVMTYASGSYFADGFTHTQVAHFSNPSVLYQGVPTGDAVLADNARTIRETKEVIAAYRVRNTKPDTPALLSPPDGATGIYLVPTLTASAYSDPDGNPHNNSQWQIARDALFTDLAWDSGESAPAATQIDVPAGQLSRNVMYYWRARYQDGRGLWSDWSASCSFRTNFMPGDFDEDGDVDQSDFGQFQVCLFGTVPQTNPACVPGRMDMDQDVDPTDTLLFLGCMSGPNQSADPACAD